MLHSSSLDDLVLHTAAGFRTFVVFYVWPALPNGDEVLSELDALQALPLALGVVSSAMIQWENIARGETLLSLLPHF